MKRIHTINPEQVSEHDAQKLTLRNAVRIVVFDDDNNVGLLNLANRGYHTLPGGGIDPGESRLTALQRECREEIGCAVRVLGELGSIKEYRPGVGKLQISYCYVGTVDGEKGSPRFTEEEVEKGCTVVWVTLEKAIGLLEADNPQDDYLGPFVKERDLIYLRAAEKVLRQT